MDHAAVRRVAAAEQRHWRPDVAAEDPVEPPHAGAAWGQEQPVTEQATREPRLTPLGVSAVGTVLILRFSWRSDPQQREFLLPVDLGDHDPEDFDGASTTVLEVVAQLTHEPSWYEYKTAPLSGKVALVLPEYIYA